MKASRIASPGYSLFHQTTGISAPGYPPSCEGLRRGRQMLELFILEKRDEAGNDEG